MADMLYRVLSLAYNIKSVQVLVFHIRPEIGCIQLIIRVKGVRSSEDIATVD